MSSILGVIDSNDDGRVGDNVLGGYEPISDGSPDPNADDNSHLSPYPVTLTLGDVDTSIDFAYQAAFPSSISGTVFEDFENGVRDWSTRDQRSIKTYKFQSPFLDRSNTRKLALTIDPGGKRLAIRLNAGSKFLSRKR